jgi:hypothetical protein
MCVCKFDVCFFTVPKVKIPFSRGGMAIGHGGISYQPSHHLMLITTTKQKSHWLT